MNLLLRRTAVGLAIALGLAAINSGAAEPKTKGKAVPSEPSPSERTFFIEGVRSDTDANAIVAAAMKVKSVNRVVDLSPSSGFANIAFDHHAVTHQQIAQAIMEAGPFSVSFKFVVPEYGTDGNAVKMDEVFARFAKLVRIEPIDRAKALFVIRFLPFKPAPGKPLGMGFNFGHIAHPIIDPAPKGMALHITQVADGSLAKPPAAGKKKAKN